MDNALKSQIAQDIKDAMRAKEALKLTTLRMLMSAIKQVEIDQKITLSEADTLAIINKMVKQRRESAQQFIAAERPELAEKEQAEIALLTHYLPTQLDESAILKAIDAAINETKASSPKDMGKVMSALKAKIEGQADMSVVSKHVRAILSQ